ncbi:MAG: septum formation initiator family protein, partial [bacterium]|nr:septum formation initiator family protein [bacterium]
LLKTIMFSKAAIVMEMALVLIFGVYVGKAVLEKRAVQSQIASMESEIRGLEHEKDSLGELIEYVQTDSFIQKEAREKLNLTAPGESVVVIPDIDSSVVDAAAPSEGAVLGASNAVLWWEYFFDRESLEERAREAEIQ